MGLSGSVGGGESVVKAVDGGPEGVVVVVVGGSVGPAGRRTKLKVQKIKLTRQTRHPHDPHMEWSAPSKSA